MSTKSNDMELIDMVVAWAAMRKSVSVGSIMRAFRIGSRKADQLFSYLIVTGEICGTGRVTKKGDNKDDGIFKRH